MNHKILTSIGVIIIFIIIIVVLVRATTHTTQIIVEEPTTTPDIFPMQENTNNGLVYTIISPGVGDSAQAGDRVSVHYVGTLESGVKFDSSRDRGEPFVFTLGRGEVIKGWDQGVIGMQIGEVRKLVIPGDLAYGSTGIPGLIPANATLIFEVELIDIIKG